MALFEPIFEALNRRNVRYVVVGGVAVVLHGYARSTADLDLMVDLEPEEARKAIEALMTLGLRSRLPVNPMEFADPERRETWAREKSMVVFSLEDPANPMRQVDLFTTNPIDFAEIWDRAEWIAIGSDRVRVASIPDLIRLKRVSMRAQDREDIEALEIIERARKKIDG